MRRDRGSVTIWAAAATALIWFVAVVAAGCGTAMIGRHRVETAADLAALAAAAHVPDGAARACGTAGAIASRNGGTLSGCVVAGVDVQVTVSTQVRLGPLGVRTAVARARAGPVDRDVSVP